MDLASCSAEGTMVQIDIGDEPDDFFMALPHFSVNDKITGTITPVRCGQRIYDPSFSLLDIWIPENILSRKTNTALNEDKPHIYHTLQKPSNASFSTYMEKKTEEYNSNSDAELSGSEIYQSDPEDVSDESDDTDYDTINKFIALSVVDNRDECKVSALIKSDFATESESLCKLNPVADNFSNISRDHSELFADAIEKTPVVALQNNLSLYEEGKLSSAVDAQLYNNNFSDDVCAPESNIILSTNDLNSDIDSTLNVYLNQDSTVPETVAYSTSSNENVIISSNNMPIPCGLDTSHNSDVYQNIPDDGSQLCDQLQRDESEKFDALQDRSYYVYTKPKNDIEKVIKNHKKNTRKAKKTMPIGLIDCNDEDYQAQLKNDAIEEFCRHVQDMSHRRDFQHGSPCEFPDLTAAASLFNHTGNVALNDKHTLKSELSMKAIANMFAEKTDEFPYKDNELQNYSIVQSPIKNKIESILIIENIPSHVDQEELENWLKVDYGEIHRFNLVPDRNHLKAELEIDVDLEWMVEILNGTQPFGACSEPLKCHIEKRNW